jgi:mannose-1-phosphate guanylyltransferase
LTATVPKPSVPLVNRPMISYMIDWLAHNSVRNIVMSCGFLAYGLRLALDEAGHESVNIRYVEESRPLGTAGAVKHAESLLDERFLVLNGDVLTEFDIGAEIAQHEATNAQATLALVPVEDPTAYGLVISDADHKIQSFLEKPDAADVPPDPRINAGAYVMERSVLDMIPSDTPYSFEHDVFPKLVGDGLYSYNADGYWLDLGTPERYLTATYDLLDGKMESWVGERMIAGGRAVEAGVDTANSQIEPPVVISDGCRIGADSRVGPYTVLGHGCVIGTNCVLDHAVIQRGATLGQRVTVERSIVGPGVVVGDGVSILGGSVIGEGAKIGAGNTIDAESRIDAGVDIPARS